jgi:hypothetical protein
MVCATPSDNVRRRSRQSHDPANDGGGPSAFVETVSALEPISVRRGMPVESRSILTCPNCATAKEEVMPENACVSFYQCSSRSPAVAASPARMEARHARLSPAMRKQVPRSASGPGLLSRSRYDGAMHLRFESPRRPYEATSVSCPYRNWTDAGLRYVPLSHTGGK